MDPRMVASVTVLTVTFLITFVEISRHVVQIVENWARGIEANLSICPMQLLSYITVAGVAILVTTTVWQVQIRKLHHVIDLTTRYINAQNERIHEEQQHGSNRRSEGSDRGTEQAA